MNPTTTDTPNQTRKITVESFRAPEGCVAYIITDADTNESLVLDPRLDQVDLLIEAAKKGGRRIKLVLDTHTHADHLSGVALLAKKTGAESMLPSDLSDDREIELGGSRIRVIPTPGHTEDAVSLYVSGHVFTGDALFVGGAGRTDFPGGSSSELFDSFRRYEELPDETVVHPGHDYPGKPTSTIGTEKKENPLMAEADRDALVKRMDVKGPSPANMMSILKFNKQGPDVDKVEAVELDSRLRLSDPIQIIDVRNPSEFDSERIAGSINIPLGQLDSRLGEIERDKPVVALCQTGVRSSDAVRRMKSVGFQVRDLENGITGWKSAGLAVEGSRRMSVERQTQMTIGTMVLVGVVLGVLVNPWLLGIAAFFGAGLVFAGASGTCALGKVISVLPWNRVEKSADAPCASSCSVGGGAPPKQKA